MERESKHGNNKIENKINEETDLNLIRSKIKTVNKLFKRQSQEFLLFDLGGRRGVKLITQSG